MGIELGGYDLRVVCENLKLAREVRKLEIETVEKRIKSARSPESIERYILEAKDLKEEVDDLKRIRSYFLDQL